MKQVYFNFPDIPPLNDFHFEKLDLDNFAQLYLLFENDESPFVDDRFKTYNSAKEYAAEILEYGATLPKHGRQDWLVNRGDNDYVGIVHLYDLSLETFSRNNERAWIGFATGQKFRKSGITRSIVEHFLKHIFILYPSINFIHAMTLLDNKAAEEFLIKCGFEKDNEERMSKKHSFFVRNRS